MCLGCNINMTDETRKNGSTRSVHDTNHEDIYDSHFSVVRYFQSTRYTSRSTVGRRHIFTVSLSFAPKVERDRCSLP